MKKQLKNISDFIVRQVTRYQYGATRFNFIFAMITAVSVFLNFLLDTGLSLSIKWYALIYVGLFLGGLIFVISIEKLGSWQIEKRQLFNMSNVDLYKDQVEYSSLKLAEALTLSSEERQERMRKIEQKFSGEKK